MELSDDITLDFGPTRDSSKNIIKVIGVGGGGGNAVSNMFSEGIEGVTFAVCNTDSQVLAKSIIPVKIQLGKSGLGAGGNPDKGREESLVSKDFLDRLLNDGTKMVFITAGMGGGTGTGAAPIVAGIAKAKGILTIGIVTIPFLFEKRRKIIKALKGVEEMRKNVDALLIINNERLCDIYSDSQVTLKEAFKRADDVLFNATKSISELITKEGKINLDFRDIETTMKNGGGAIMAMGKAKGEHRVAKAIYQALDSPLIYGNDIGKAKKILFNIYAGEQAPLFVNEMREIDDFMDELDPNIDVIWGVSDDDIGDDVKVTILATGFDEDILDNNVDHNNPSEENEYYNKLINRLYVTKKKEEKNVEDIPFSVSTGDNEEEKTGDNNSQADGNETGNNISESAQPKEDTQQEENAQEENPAYDNEPVGPAAENNQQKQDVDIVQETEYTEPAEPITEQPQQKEVAPLSEKDTNQVKEQPKTEHAAMTFAERIKEKMRQMSKIALDLTQDENYK